MTRRLSYFAALALAAFGSMPASAIDRQADTTTIAMNEQVETIGQPAVLHARLNPAEPAVSAVRDAIEIDKTSAADYSYRAQFQAERGFLELALADLSTAAEIARFSRDEMQQKILLRAFEPTAATNADGLTDGFSRVVEYKW